MNVGVLIVVNNKDVEAKFKQVRDLGFKTCQITCWNHSVLDDELAEKINMLCEKYPDLKEIFNDV